MLDELSQLIQEAESEVAAATSTAELGQIETKYLGGKGSVQAQLRAIGALPKEERPAFGARINAAKQSLSDLIEARKAELSHGEIALRLKAEAIDVTLPGRALPRGGRHPLTQTMQRVKQVLSGQGFECVDEQMTFYVDDGHLLRTQTTALQGRVMQNRKPPFRIATTGRCFRYEAVDATHHHTFHQVDVFMVDEGISMADLKGTLKQFASTMFGGDVQVRFRPDFFPFVEPGVDYSIYWQDRWLELGGAGLMHPNILETYGIDTERYSGFAFGLGIERIHMIQNGVNDLRLYLENDLRFLRQF
jgi:phenylalanyl-tRNA synthetase alpha chain